MARFARIVVPDTPHHVTQRGARRMQVFFSRSDYLLYLALLAERARHYGLAVWAYCLMPNHVHVIAVPSTSTGLGRSFGEAHQRYAQQINRRNNWTGHLWQERFASFPMDEVHLLAAIRYVLLNPVRAGLVDQPTEWPHSSARSHVYGDPDPLVDPGPASERISDWNTYLKHDECHRETEETLRRHGRIGRPLGSGDFIDRIERACERRVRPRKPGRRPQKK